jgi:hypothetical protein
MIGNGKIGTITKRLKALFEAAVHGNDRKFSGIWLMPID